MKIKSHSLLCVLATIALSSPLTAMGVNAQKATSHTWNPNVKSGMYRNPVIDADYSDPADGVWGFGFMPVEWRLARRRIPGVIFRVVEMALCALL